MRTMDLTDLHIFRAVVQAGGITRAAEKLNRVQSNVTTRVRQLESELGVELFIRNGKKLHLSPAGKLLLDYADRLLDLAEEAREAVQDAKPRGLLRLGSMESTASMRLPVPDASVDAVTIAFGIRNVQDPVAALRDFHRVLRPGGTLVILEFGFPWIPGIKQAYRLYFKYGLPVVGRMISRHNDAYTYLPASVAEFPNDAAFVKLV